MGDVVNLNHYRKRRDRAERERRAAQMRALSGRGKGQKEIVQQDSERHESDLDGKLIDRGPSDD